MEKKFNRVLSLVLALVMVISLMPVGHLHAHAEEIDSTSLVSYRWETTEGGNSLTNITTEGYTANAIELSEAISGGKMDAVYGTLKKPIVLRPTDAWAIEWECVGTWEGMLLSKSATYSTTGNQFVYHPGPNKPYTLGVRNKFHGSGYWNYGHSKALVEAAFTEAGKTFTSADVHVFRIENRIEGNTNLPYLIIDGVEIGAMTNVYSGSNATTSFTNDTSWSGQTIEFYYFSSPGKQLEATGFSYLEITGAHAHSGDWVKGETGISRTCACGHVDTVSYTANRWEMNAEGNAVASVESDGYYVQNALSGTSGTVADGNISAFKRTIATAVAMDHTKPWVIEWEAAGTWKGMLLSKTTTYSTDGNVFVYHPESGKPYTLGSSFTHPSNNTAGFWNYGFTEGNVGAAFTAAGKTFDREAVHTFRIENRVTNGTAVWYLIIDGVEIGAMTNVYSGSKTSPTFTNDTLLMQTDFSFKYIGATSKLLTAADFGYIEIWPNGKPAAQEEPDEPEHVCEFVETEQVVPGEDCEHVGYTVWACECGETENRPNEVKGEHAWDEGIHTDGTCVEFGSTYYECGLCGETKDVADTVYGDHVYTSDCDTVCDLCSETREASVEHTYDNAEDTDCNVCGTERDLCQHQYDNDCDTDCNNCGAPREVEDHKYDNDCDADCNNCGAPREVEGHKYDNDCDADCNICGTPREVEGHKYDNACDVDCNNCGDVREVPAHSFGAWVGGETGNSRTCSVCGESETNAYYAYRWEVNADVFQSVDTDGYYVKNQLTGTDGSVSEGVFSNVARKISTPVQLDHTKPWVIEWESSKNWEGFLLVTGSNKSSETCYTLYRSGNLGLGMGVHANSAYQHFGVNNNKISSYMSATHTYTLENQFNEDGTNVVVLKIDGNKVADMTNYFRNSTDSTDTNNPLGADWLSNADLTYKYIGYGSHALDKIMMSYLEVWPNGIPAQTAHNHAYNIKGETVDGENCKESGYVVWSCLCGESIEVENGIMGEHGFSEYVKRVEGTNCQTSGYDIWKCAWCEETKTIETSIMGEHNFTIDGGHTDGTCQTLGYTTWHCEQCGTETKIVYDEAFADHNFDTYVETVNGANCQTAGYDVFKCHWCDETENRPNEVKGDHSFGEWVMDVAFESLTRTCACGETESANFAQEIWDSETREYSYVGYQDFEEALAAAQGAYDFLYLMVDAEIEDLYLSQGTWLDLNGHVLTANSVYVDDGDAYIVDFKYGGDSGLLKAPKDMVRLPENDWGMLPIWDPVREGYVFTYCQDFQDMMDTNTPNTLKFYFLPEYLEEDLALLAAGKEVSGVEMKIKMSWTKDGVADSRVLTFSNYDQLIQQFLDGYDPETGKFAQAFRLTVTGTDLVDEGSLQFMVFFESVTGAIETLGQGQ